jgi:putative peptidoglycan lipid II flippase
MLADFLPAMIAFSIIYVNAFIDRFYASQIAPGAIAALNYADKLTQVPLAVLGSAISIAIIPIFTRHLHAGRRDRLRRDLLRSLLAALALALLIAAGIIALRLPVIHLLFGRGRLTPADTALASLALGFYALTIVPEIGTMILMRVFHAERKVWTPAFFTVGAVVMHVLLASWLAPRWGIRGIGVALVASSCLYFILIALAVWSRLRLGTMAANATGGPPTVPH